MKQSIILILLLFQNVYSQNTHVLFGERDLRDNKSAIYFDKDGSIYPDYLIPDTALANSESSLLKWYKANPVDFYNIAKLYKCPFTIYNDENFKILNDSIANNLKKKIIRNGSYATSLTFLIHGFRKPFNIINHDRPAGTDFKTMITTLDKYLTPTSYVEVYWDGLYGCCFSAKASENKILFRLFEEAQKNNTINVGKSLKMIISDLNSGTINIVSHSLGAKVAAYALFDIDNDGHKTPANNIVNIYLIAPAIAADIISNNYYKRNSTIDYKSKDNYRLMIAYNEKDFVLRKKDNKVGLFGPGPKKYGNTTLGCNYHNEAVKLKMLFEKQFPNSPIKMADLTFVDKCHHVRCYFDDDNLKGLFTF
ncbi:alpha/beta hydrolase [Flavobacterium sp. GT3R68]|uniref:alpha/beta hydrolase n=1 Tax=Flavobacterium sp. GT3R68 TaxID=2594437 RepID=UPI000F892BDB|nr:alpha/beta hydrolase [Flavobacterium sp. GT3R68]RTY95131.1 alpha/beta hydrolase [Flavobacterium sp. GSN2]TRW91127.1 alpha/beta hydrolase [Flavobacterium sp. GT3R68]